MKEWNGELNQTELYQLDHWYPPEKVLLFDIETTGFSPENTLLYMIGVCFFQENRWHYRMLFNNDGCSEHQLLYTFLELLQHDSVLIHFNGDGFDLPYLIEKCRQYQTLGLPLPGTERLTSLESVDLYKCIRTYKHGLGLSNLKLTTIEAAMQLPRTDTHSGGELISVYRDFLKEPEPFREKLLFQHNYEDILAIIPLLQLLHFRGIQEHAWKLAKTTITENQIQLILQLHYPLPLRYITSSYYCDFNGYEDQAVITIPVLKEEMKYFLSDWKEYYYLPLEDTIIHKSVASYVDSAYKEKAKKRNCFLKKEDFFFPCPCMEPMAGIRLYQRTYKDSLSFAALSELPSDASDFWLNYLKYSLDKPKTQPQATGYQT